MPKAMQELYTRIALWYIDVLLPLNIFFAYLSEFKILLNIFIMSFLTSTFD